MSSEPIRRLPSGAIDYEFYHRRAACLRANSIGSVVTERRDVLRLLVAASFAVALVWLLRAPTDAVDGKDAEAACPSPEGVHICPPSG